MQFGVILKYLPLLADGWRTTLELTLWTVLGGLILGMPLAVARSARAAVPRCCALAVIEVVRGTPIIMLIFWIYFLLPRIIGAPVPAYVAGLGSLIVFNAAYSAEIVRAGIESVEHGQIDAGCATGLNWLQIMRLVILPQALSNMTSALINQVVMVYKTTSLIYVIGVVDLFRAAIFVDNREYLSFEIYTFVGLMYLIPSTAISWWSRALERRRRRHRGIMAAA